MNNKLEVDKFGLRRTETYSCNPGVFIQELHSIRIGMIPIP